MEGLCLPSYCSRQAEGLHKCGMWGCCANMYGCLSDSTGCMWLFVVYEGIHGCLLDEYGCLSDITV